LDVIAQFEDIYTEFNARLRRFILNKVSDPATADDILQEVFLKIHDRIDTLRDAEKLQSWVYQITRNAIIDHYRRDVSMAELPEALALPEEYDEPDTVSELGTSVRLMLNCLEEKYQQALLLTEYQGLTQQEMASRLGISLSGAKSRVQRARDKLKNALLDCCHFEFDRLGKVISYHPRCSSCATSHYPQDSEQCESGEEQDSGCDTPESSGSSCGK
jgi:RNA polymerase sigma-70 factor, ECF subfamily